MWLYQENKENREVILLAILIENISEVKEKDFRPSNY